MKTLITSDWHLGVRRSAGTTPESSKALQARLLAEFDQLLTRHTDKDVLIAGDLFDNFTVDTHIVLETFYILSDHLLNSKGTLFLQAGNHDWAPRAAQVSSFHLLAGILQTQWGDRVVVADQGFQILKSGLAVISHVPNQDLLNIEVEKALVFKNHWIVCHANYDNHFAVASDHSLNLDQAQIGKLTEHNRLLMAHEHQHRTMQGGNAICMGNPYPSSVSDCMAKGAGQTDGLKYAWILDDSGVLDKEVTWNALESYQRIDWRDLDEAGDAQFIRVSGDATAAEASQVIDAIAKLRGKSAAYVISNAVRIDGQEGAEDAAEEIFQGLKGFNVMGALLDELNAEERKVVEEVMA